MAGALALLTFGVCFLGGIAAGVVLVLHGHPWFALLTLLITCSLSLKTGSGE